MDKYVVILAAGRGSRMQSRDPNHSKVSYPILDKPLINYVLDATKTINPTKIVVVVGFGGEVTKSLVEKEAEVVWQKVINGTGGAVLTAKPLLEGKPGLTLVVCGDTPLITSETIHNVFRIHEKAENDLTVVAKRKSIFLNKGHSSSLYNFLYKPLPETRTLFMPHQMAIKYASIARFCKHLTICGLDFSSLESA